MFVMLPIADTDTLADTADPIINAALGPPPLCVCDITVNSEALSKQIPTKPNIVVILVVAGDKADDS